MNTTWIMTANENVYAINNSIEDFSRRMAAKPTRVEWVLSALRPGVPIHDSMLYYSAISMVAISVWFLLEVRMHGAQMCHVLVYRASPAVASNTSLGQGSRKHIRECRFISICYSTSTLPL